MSDNKVKGRIWIVIGILTGIVVIYFALIYPFILHKQVSADLETEEQRLENYLTMISQKPEKDALLEEIMQRDTQYKDMLFESNKPPVVAADLQNILKEISGEEGVDIISEKQLTIEEKGIFIRIPVDISVKCTITKLTNLIYAIEDYKKFLDISRLSIRVINTRNPTDVRADMTVSGFILAREIPKEG